MTTAPRCPHCGQRLAGQGTQPPARRGSNAESLREQLREAKLGSLRKDGEIERLRYLLNERGHA